MQTAKLSFSFCPLKELRWSRTHTCLLIHAQFVPYIYPCPHSWSTHAFAESARGSRAQILVPSQWKLLFSSRVCHTANQASGSVMKWEEKTFICDRRGVNQSLNWFLSWTYPTNSSQFVQLLLWRWQVTQCLRAKAQYEEFGIYIFASEKGKSRDGSKRNLSRDLGFCDGKGFTSVTYSSFQSVENSRVYVTDQEKVALKQYHSGLNQLLFWSCSGM